MISPDTVTSLIFYVWGTILMSPVSLGNHPAKGHLLENILELNVSSGKRRDVVKTTRVRHNRRLTGTLLEETLELSKMLGC